MPDPRKVRKTKRLYKKVFPQKEIYDLFFSYYEEAVKAGSPIPLEMAWIKLRENYIETNTGWVAYNAG